MRTQKWRMAPLLIAAGAVWLCKGMAMYEEYSPEWRHDGGAETLRFERPKVSEEEMLEEILRMHDKEISDQDTTDIGIQRCATKPQGGRRNAHRQLQFLLASPAEWKQWDAPPDGCYGGGCHGLAVNIQLPI